MNSHLRVLIVEDSEDDTLLILRELRRGGYTLDYVRVDTPILMHAALDRQLWDIVIADYTLPAFSAPEALKLLQTRKLDLPFIIVSGTIGEDIAVAAMKAGAHDYLIKGNFARLVPAVERELREAQERYKRHKAEQALQESEERFRQLAENITEMVFWISNPKERQMLYVSPAYESIWGRSCKSLYGNCMEWLEAIHPQDRQRVQTVFFEHSLTGMYNEEYRIIRPDGSWRWIRDRGFPIRDFSGEPNRVVGIAEDITSSKLAEEELRDSEARYRLLFESNPNPMWVFDLQTLAFLAVNQAAIAHYGYSKAEFLSMTLANIHPPKDIKALHETQSTLTQGQNYVGVWKHRKKNGSAIDVEVMAHTFSFAGEPACLVLVDDITERKQAEQKIREQAALLDVATDAIFVRDMGHHILFWNKSAERLYGWQTAEVLGKNAAELLHNEKTPSQFEAIQTTLAKEGKWQGELQQVTKSGKDIIVESRWTLVRDETGNPKSILTVSTDITEKKQLEAQFLRAQRLESVGTLASGIAHDFNNILTPILAVSQLLPLKFPLLDDNSQQLLKILEGSAKRGADMVKQILSFTRGVEGSRTNVQIRHLLSDVAQVAGRTFPKSIETKTNIASDLWTVFADATQIHQVLINLSVNARDAMLDGGTLTISAENLWIDESYARMYVDAEVGPYVAIAIADTGIGISPEIIDRIFDPFFTTKEVGKGTGLGLSTVMGIIKSHGGFVNVHSEMGKGSCFQVYIPSNQVAETPASANEKIPIGNDELVLVVDDEVSICEIAKTTLETHNYRVLTASDGIEALALYAQYQDNISAVLIDMMMPGMDGSTTIITLRRMNPQVQIIAMSGLMVNWTLAQKRSLGIQKFLSKPFTAQVLLNTLQSLLDSSLSEE
jgi:PAS domain S-box-containing protein